MGWLIRKSLLWLLVLAVPAQGLAAATMVFCGPGHHGSQAAAAAQPDGDADHAHHAHHGSTVHADEADAVSAAAPSNGPVDAGHVTPAAKKCSACASCCSIGAMLSPALAVPAPLLTPTVFHAVVVSVDLFVVDGPDRPPRNICA